MRPHSLITVALLLLPLFPRSALAQQQRRWKQIGTTSSNNPVFVDPKSVSRANGSVTATLRVQFAEPVKTPSGAWTSSRTVAAFDCAKRLVMVKENTYYLDEKKNKIAAHSAARIPGWQPILKGALPDVAAQYLCGK